MKNFIIILLLVFGIWCFFFYKAPVTQVNQVTPEMKVITDAEVDRVNDIIDEKGFHHAVIDEVENTVEDISRVRDSAKQELDSIINLLDIERSRVKEWRQYAVSWKDSFMTATRVNDSLFKYSSKNLNIEFVNRVDTPYFNYRYDANINHLSYWSKKTFLSPKRHYIDFWIEDPRATINGVRRIKIQSPIRPRIEVNAVGRYDIRPLGGGEVYYRNGRMGVGIGYLYDFEQKEWLPSINTKFNIIEF